MEGRKDAYQSSAQFNKASANFCHGSVSAVSQSIQSLFEDRYVIMQLLFVLFKRKPTPPTRPASFQKVSALTTPWEKGLTACQNNVANYCSLKLNRVLCEIDQEEGSRSLVLADVKLHDYWRSTSKEPNKVWWNVFIF